MKLNATDARHFCEKVGGDLASIESSADYDKYFRNLTNKTSNGVIRIGLQYDDWWKRWLWIDGLNINYTKWVEGAPFHGQS